MGEVLRLTYDAEGPARLDAWLASRCEDLSRSRIQALLDAGAITSGDVALGPRDRLAPGAEIVIALPDPAPAEPVPQDIPLDILYEDECVIVVNKPAGMVVHPAPGHGDSTFVNALLFHCGDELAGVGGVARPGIVHRLDMDTTGILVAAKDERSLNSLAAQFQAHTTEKRYAALVHGVIQRESGRIETTIGRHPTDRLRMAANPPRGGKSAVTRWKVARRLSRTTLLDVLIETGRTHQIRVHMAYARMPIVGDPLYGNRSLDAAIKDCPPRQMLHAAHFAFDHPVTGRRMSFDAPLPDDFERILANA